MWSVGTILTGLLSFMYDTQATTGSITSTKHEKERMARDSLAFNAKNPTFRKLFPNWVEELSRRTMAAAQPATLVTVLSPPLGTPSESPQSEHGTEAEHALEQHQGEGQVQGDGVAGAAQPRQPQQRPAPHPQQPFGTTIVTLAIVVAVLAAVWVSSSSPGRDMLRAWAPWPAAGRMSS